MPDALARRVGPFPVWGWIVAALVIYFVWFRRNRPGWFPTGSGTIGPDDEGGGVMLGARLGFGGGGDVPTEEPAEGAGSAGFTSLGRDRLPSSIMEGGPDGSVDSGGGGGETSSGGSTAYVPPGPYSVFAPKPEIKGGTPT